MTAVKLPKSVTVYGIDGKIYKGEIPEHLVDKKVLGAAVKKAIGRAEANRDRHAKYKGHAESDALVLKFEAELADLKGETPPAPPTDPPGDKGKGKGKGKGDK